MVNISKMADGRRDGTLPWVRPDSKSQVSCLINIKVSISELKGQCFQVTMEYKLDGGACVPIRVHTVVISVQHSEDITLEEMRMKLKDLIKVWIRTYINGGRLYEHINHAANGIYRALFQANILMRMLYTTCSHQDSL